LLLLGLLAIGEAFKFAERIDQLLYNVDNRQYLARLKLLELIGRLAKSTFREHIVARLRAAVLSGELAPGSPLIETTLAERFDVSRAPLREALRQLVEEGWLMTIPYTGTWVIQLTAQDVREIHSLRTVLEKFAFEQAWDKRDKAFRGELRKRHLRLTDAIDRHDDVASIVAEIELHGLVYEASGHQLLQRGWDSLRGRLQLYWAAHHRAHVLNGPRRDAHDNYVKLALGESLEAMQKEISHHMQRGASITEIALEKSFNASILST
jgi:DNA-binding GntR family transcriptional regulator